MANIILCPGQGAQIVGMGRDYFEKSDAARKVFESAGNVLGFDLAKLCFEGPDVELNKTDISQPAIYVTSIACHAAASAAGKMPTADLQFAGLSLGEYTALHLAGVFSFEDGLKLVRARGLAMQRAAEANPSTMVAVMGADEPAIEKLCADCAQGEVLVPANFNAPGQIVVSGNVNACARLTDAASAAGFRAIPLTVAGAFHSPLMQAGADAMKVELERVTFNPPRSTVYSNVTARPHTDPASIRALLVDQIIKPVRWEQTLAPLANDPAHKFVELAPGKVLTGLLKKQNRRAEVQSLASADALA